MPVLLLIFGVLPLRPQPTALSFRHVTTSAGLSQGTINCILEDRNGFLWFGTQDGLNQFDGYQFKVFRNDPDDPNSLSHHWIHALIEDKKGDLWIGTESGLTRYDRKLEQFFRFQHDPKKPTSLSADRVLCLLEDHSGTIWVGTEKGLCRYDRQKGGFSPYPDMEGDTLNLKKSVIRTIFQDHSNHLWIAMENGGLVRIIPGSERMKHYSHDPDRPGSLSHDNVNCMVEDAEGELWIGTEGGGLNRYDADTDRFESYIFDPENPQSLSHNTISAVIPGERNDLWIGTKNGLNRFEKGNRLFTRYQNDPDNPDSLNQNSISSLYRNSSGQLWVGCDIGGGISFFDPKKVKFSLFRHIQENRNSLGMNTIFGLIEDKEGFIWIATSDAGLDRYDRKTRTFSHFNADPGNPDRFPFNDIWSILEDSKGRFWVGTHRNGLVLFDRKTRQFRQYRHDPGNPRSLRDNMIWHIQEDRNGQVWVATNFGLHAIEPDSGNFTVFLPNPENDAHIRNQIRYIFEDNQGTLWAGTRGGLVRFDRQSETFTVYAREPGNRYSISENSVRSIFQAKNGMLWICTNNGLNRFDAKSNRFTHYSAKDGLPNNDIYGILEDEKGYLWMSTNKGIARFDPVREIFRTFDRSDGLQAEEFNSLSFLQTRDGELFFGGVDGLNSFFPSQILNDSDQPEVQLTGFQIFNRPVPIGQDRKGRVILKEPIGETKKLTLSYRDYIFSFEFVAIHFGANEKIQYAYMMEGLEKEWNYIGDRRFAAYSTLPAGKYRFKVKASSNDGSWGNDDSTSLDIVILPPFWKTWWFISGCGVFIFSGSLFAYRRRVSQLTQRKEELEKMVAQRTQQLKEISLRDPLTGLRNRRFIAEILIDDINAFLKKKLYIVRHTSSRRQRNDRYIYGILMIDIDFFKSINDLYGHDMGDKWLKQLAETMRESVRGDDEVIRLGGEEFLVVLKNMDPEKLAEFTSKLRGSLAEIDLAKNNQELKRTCSIGFTPFPFYADAPDLLSFEEIMILADLGLYQAKKQGRDQSVLVSPGTHLPTSEQVAQMLNDPEFGRENGFFLFSTC